MQHDLSNLGNIFGNYYKGYEQARTPQRLAQEELARHLNNEIQKVDLRYKPQQYESQIGHNNALTGLTREQMKWLGPEKMAQIRSSQAMAAEHEAKTEKLRRQQAFIQQILAEQGYGGQGGEMGMNAQQPQLNQMPQLSGMPGGSEQPNIFGPQASQQLPQSGMPEMAPQQGIQPQTRKPISPLAESLMAQIMGIDPIKPIVNTENELVQPSLFGGEPKITKIGPSEAEREFKKTTAGEEAKYSSAEKEATYKKIEAAHAKKPIFAELRRIVNSPEFYTGTGPVASRIRKLTNNKDVNAMAGQLNNALGTLVNTSFREAFGNRGTQGEFQAMNRLMGSSSNNPYELKSQIDFMDAMSRFDLDVNTKYLNNLETMGRLEARQKAYEDANYGEVTNVLKMEDLTYKAARTQKSDYGTVLKAAQRFSEDTGVPLEQALKELGDKHGK